jgi:hypothetical protein
MSDATGRSMSQLVDDAAEALERQMFFDQLTSGYDGLRDDPEAWAEIEAERAIEGSTLRDEGQ